MKTRHFLRGMATANYWADDVAAARNWYADLLGVQAYFQRPDETAPAYVEFRIGDDADEFGIVARRYAPGRSGKPGGMILYWHVDDLNQALQALLAKGATLNDPATKRGETGFATASVVDPFGNVLGIMTNPHFRELHGGAGE